MNSVLATSTKKNKKTKPLHAKLSLASHLRLPSFCPTLPPSYPPLPSSSGYAGYKLCYYEVMRVIKGKVHQPYEVKGSSIFYAFSYYFDRAVESGLIGEYCVHSQEASRSGHNLPGSLSSSGTKSLCK